MNRPSAMSERNEQLARRAHQVFRADLVLDPPITLRGGNALDDYEKPPAFNPRLDEPTDTYLEQYAHYGLTYLDPPSWRHYLPRLIDYALRHYNGPDTPAGGLAIEGLMASLRPPDREPARFASLSPDQRALVTEFLTFLAFDERSGWQEEALELLVDYWEVPEGSARG
jgi:hypothetical protein